MGAVQKLATVVIIGLVALATALTVFIANEPDRRGSETTEQQDIAVVRGTDLYIQYCLQCHGPAGLGAGAEDGRIGAVLNQDFYLSDDPAQQQQAEEVALYRLRYGAPSDPRQAEKLMPAFTNELNVEEINDLIYLITSDNWNYVYNASVQYGGENLAEAECEENEGEGEFCGNLEEAPPVYPTAPVLESPEQEEEQDEQDDDAPAGDVALQLEARDPYEWSESEITLAPGDSIEVTNVGALQHNFEVEELGIAEELPAGEPVVITIPEDAEPGEYEFICSVPGHAEGGMVGTLTIEG